MVRVGMAEYNTSGWCTDSKRVVDTVQGEKLAMANAGLAKITGFGSGRGAAHQCFHEGLKAAADSLIQGNSSRVFGSSSKNPRLARAVACLVTRMHEGVLGMVIISGLYNDLASGCEDVLMLGADRWSCVTWRTDVLIFLRTNSPAYVGERTIMGLACVVSIVQHTVVRMREKPCGRI